MSATPPHAAILDAEGVLKLFDQPLGLDLYVSDLIDKAKAHVKATYPHDPLDFSLVYSRVLAELALNLESVVKKYHQDMGLFKPSGHA